MLTRTFSHIHGIGKDTEAHLWEQGCITWQHYLDEPDRFSVGTAAREIVRGTLERSTQALENQEHQYFAQKLGLAEAWRAWPEFRSRCAYLDIETDGGRTGSAVTLIGLYDGQDFKTFIKGDNIESFRDEISNYSMIVTFFGSGFDVPMLQKRFRNVLFDHLHLDLCPTLRRLGYRGGLKKIEKQLGINRVDEADGLSGLDAIRLWREHERGKENSLETLIAYNREDVVNLERLADIAYKGLVRQIKAPDLNPKEPTLF